LRQLIRLSTANDESAKVGVSFDGTRGIFSFPPLDNRSLEDLSDLVALLGEPRHPSPPLSDVPSRLARPDATEKSNSLFLSSHVACKIPLKRRVNTTHRGIHKKSLKAEPFMCTR
jgi:hypothetical protein